MGTFQGIKVHLDANLVHKQECLFQKRRLSVLAHAPNFYIPSLSCQHLFKSSSLYKKYDH